MTDIQPARTYNQTHVARKYAPGKRRISIYWTWSYPWESSRNVAEMDNRFSTMTEVRRVAWPAYEGPEWGSANFLQGIDGTLELFHRSTLSFQQTRGRRDGPSRGRVPARGSSGFPVADRRADSRRHGHVDGVRARSPAVEPRGLEGGDRSDPRLARARGDVLAARAASRRRLHRRSRAAAGRVQASPRCARAAPAAFRHVHALADEGARRSRVERVGPATGDGRRHARHCAAAGQPRSRRARAAEGRDDLQFPPASASLRADGERRARNPRARPAADRPRAAASVHCCRQQGAQRFCCGCRRRESVPATSCSSIRRISRRCSAARKASRISGATSRECGDAAHLRSRRRRVDCARREHGERADSRRLSARHERDGLRIGRGSRAQLLEHVPVLLARPGRRGPTAK